MLFPFLLASIRIDRLGCHHQTPDTSLACHRGQVILLCLIGIDEFFHPSRLRLVAQGLLHALHQSVDSLLVQQVFLVVVPKDRQVLWRGQPLIVASCLLR
jgi:hypothetical protein